jgi:hypothetical protein
MKTQSVWTTVARSQERWSANSSEKFGQMGNLIKTIAHKVQNFMQKTMYFIKYFFDRFSVAFVQKRAAAANFSGPSLSFFGRFKVIL